jgi:hypothetical protein
MKNRIFEALLKDFFMTNPMPSSKIFYDFLFRSYKRLNQRFNKKLQKLLFFRPVFANPFWDLLDSNTYNFKTKKRKRFSKTALDSNASEVLFLKKFVSLQQQNKSVNI